MDRKKEFESAAKSLCDILNQAAENVSDRHVTTISELADIIGKEFGLIDDEPKTVCNENTCKKENTCKNDAKKNECSCSSACSFSMSIGNNGVHVYRTNDDCYINDHKVSRESYDKAVRIMDCTGTIANKINSIQDILNEDTKISENSKRISELEASIAKAQEEIKRLRENL